MWRQRNVLCEENPSLASPFTLLGIETSLPAVYSPFERVAHLWLIYQRQKSLSVPKDCTYDCLVYGEYNAFDTKRKFVTGPNFHVRPLWHFFLNHLKLHQWSLISIVLCFIFTTENILFYCLRYSGNAPYEW